MSGTYAAVIPLFSEPEERHNPTLEDTICFLRWRHPEMIETLDDRMRLQKELVLEILLKKGRTPRDLLRLSLAEADGLEDVELRLCYRILRDVEYIDSLR